MAKLSVEACQKLSINSLSGVIVGNSVEVNSQTIIITQTKCNYGGYRAWFICSGCSRRVGKLYRPPLFGMFLCRYCLGLTYDLRKYHRTLQEPFIKAVNSIRNNS